MEGFLHVRRTLLVTRQGGRHVLCGRVSGLPAETCRRVQARARLARGLDSSRSRLSTRAISIHVVQDFLLEGIQTQFAGLVICNDRFLNRQNLSLGSIDRVIAEATQRFPSSTITRFTYSPGLTTVNESPWLAIASIRKTFSCDRLSRNLACLASSSSPRCFTLSWSSASFCRSCFSRAAAASGTSFAWVAEVLGQVLEKLARLPGQAAPAVTEAMALQPTLQPRQNQSYPSAVRSTH